MIVIPLASLEIRKRQRQKPPGHITALRESILSTGLLHPPVCWKDETTGTWVLTAGECRVQAIKQISASGKAFRHGGLTISAGGIPITELSDYLDELGRFEAELDENIHREALDWKDQAQAFSDLHDMRVRSNPKQSLRDTGKELADRGFKKPDGEGFANERSLEKVVRKSRVIAEHLSDPKISLARNESEALALIYKKVEEAATAALVKRRIASASVKSSLEVRHEDLLVALPLLDSGIADLFLSDPPYGIGASTGGFRSRTVHHHNYEDTAANAQLIARTILTEGFRICKPRANVFMFCDIRLFDWLKQTAENMGWSAFPRPLIWQKSESEGLAPWGGSGPRITTEFIFYATKGRRGMNTSPIDWFNVKRVPRNERIHAAEKPVELLRRLIEITTLPDDLVIDPCCGSGSTLVACKELRRRGLGIEIDVDYYNTALANVHGGDSGPTAA